MRDSEVVAAIVAGESHGLAEAYDRYASPLYAYCRSLLRDPADAADAVQDTFVIAASKLAGLRDQSRLKPWLYAVARNECRRRLRVSAAEATSALDAVPEMSDESVDVTGSAERAELRALLRSAVRGLNAGEQDLMELQLRQGLEVTEIAAVLGVSRNHAHALLSRARDQLEISLGALLVARTGRQECAALSTLLGDWDGQLNVLMRKRINRHIENCTACADRKRRELAPALLLGLAPLAALPIAAMPAGLRAQVLRLASSNTPEALAHRADVAQRAAAFGRHGFPKRPTRRGLYGGPGRRSRRGRRGGGRRGGDHRTGAERRAERAPRPAERPGSRPRRRCQRDAGNLDRALVRALVRSLGRSGPRGAAHGTASGLAQVSPGPGGGSSPGAGGGSSPGPRR